MEPPNVFMVQAAVAQADEAATASSVDKYRAWKTQQIFFNLGRVSLILLIIFVICAVVKALLHGQNLLWLFYIPETPEEVGEFAAVLAPLVAISVAIERLLEQVFDYLEKSLVNVADFLNAPVDFLKAVQEEYKKAYIAVKDAARTVRNAQSPTSEELGTLEQAKRKLAEIEQSIRDLVKQPEYVAWKRYLSIVLSFSMGLGVAALGDLGMFRMIGFPTPRIFDMLITGMIIGAGPGPMHSIIGILQNGKDALGRLSSPVSDNALQQTVQELQDEIIALKRTR